MPKIVLDTSNNNPITDALLKQSGAVALIAKASEGTSFSDQTLRSQRLAARRAGIPFGAYLFFHADKDPKAQIDLFLRDAALRPGDIQPVIDFEVTDNEPQSELALRIDAAVTQLEHHGYRPILYIPVWLLLQVLELKPSLAKRVRVWEPQYPRRVYRWLPGLYRLRIRIRHGVSVVLWQFTDSYRVGAVKGFDASVLLTSLAKIKI